MADMDLSEAELDLEQIREILSKFNAEDHMIKLASRAYSYPEIMALIIVTGARASPAEWCFRRENTTQRNQTQNSGTDGELLSDDEEVLDLTMANKDKLPQSGLDGVIRPQEPLLDPQFIDAAIEQVEQRCSTLKQVIRILSSNINTAREEQRQEEIAFSPQNFISAVDPLTNKEEISEVDKVLTTTTTNSSVHTGNKVRPAGRKPCQQVPQSLIEQLEEQGVTVTMNNN